MRQRACLCILLSALAGCESAERIPWIVAFRHAEDEARATRVEARLHEGSCEGETTYTATLGEPGAMAPPRLGRGSYGFAGRALDASCTWFATGCVELEVPARDLDQVRVELDRDARPVVAGDCPAILCGTGTCQTSSDAGCEAGSSPGCPFGACEQNVCIGTESLLTHGRDTMDGHRLGYAVDVDGDWAVAAAPYADSTAGSLSGEVHVLERDGADWRVHDVLLPDGSLDYFGLSVAIDRSLVLVGAPEFDSNAPGPGAAYLFAREAGEWTERATLRAPSPEIASRFGFAVALWGHTAVVGAPSETGPGELTRAGAAYVFERNPDTGTWSQVAHLTATEPTAEDSFGRAVAIEGPRIAVGSLFDDEAAVNAGAVYVFERSDESWSQTAILVPGDPAQDQELGWTVAISGSRIAAGTRNTASSTGAVYVFEDGGNGFRQTAKVMAPGGSAGDRFGSAVSLVGNLLLVGASGADERELGLVDVGRGSLFEWREGRWNLVARLDASDAADEAHFGWSAALAPDVAIVGALRDGPDGDGRGGAYFFQLSDL